jgi:hypothetical protein
MAPQEEMTKEEEQAAIDQINEMYQPNRAERRRKPMKPRMNVHGYIIVPSNILTSPAHKYKKIRKENAPSKQQRKRTIAKARKSLQAHNTQES